VRIELEARERRLICSLLLNCADRVQDRGARKLFKRISNKFLGERPVVELKKLDVACIVDLVKRAQVQAKDDSRYSEVIGVLESACKKLLNRLAEEVGDEADDVS
jgi:hypothetical protein